MPFHNFGDAPLSREWNIIIADDDVPLSIDAEPKGQKASPVLALSQACAASLAVSTTTYRLDQSIAQAQLGKKGPAMPVVKGLALSTCNNLVTFALMLGLKPLAHEYFGPSKLNDAGIVLLAGLIQGPLSTLKTRGMVGESLFPKTLGELWSGTSPSIARNTAFWMTVSLIAPSLSAKLKSSVQAHPSLELAKEVLVGAASGALATIASHPFDTVAKFNKVHTRLSSVECFQKLWETGGWRSFATGLPRNQVRQAVAFAVANASFKAVEALSNQAVTPFCDSQIMEIRQPNKAFDFA